MGQENGEATTLKREELYRQVWEMPMNRLAKRYGISGSGLAAICRRLHVPYPPPGYWIKKEFGKETVRTPLPSAPPDTPDVIQITPPARRPKEKPIAAPPCSQT